jgi:nucleoside-diphosphate-sugar epimerase
VIPEIIAQLSRGNQVTLGNIKARRDFTYVDDAAHAAAELMKCDAAIGQVFNLGSGQDWSIAELAEEIGDLLGWKKIDVTVDKARLRPLDVDRLCCDNTRIREIIGWKPKTSLHEGLKKMLEWYQNNGGTWIWEVKMGPEDQIWQYGKK